jgi:hypothetical protein
LPLRCAAIKKGSVISSANAVKTVAPASRYFAELVTRRSHLRKTTIFRTLNAGDVFNLADVDPGLIFTLIDLVEMV